MEKGTNKSIKMTDSDFKMIKQMAADRKLTLGKYIVNACKEYGSHSNEINPEITCRLQTVRNMLNIPTGSWNEEMKAVFNKDVEELCALLKW